MDIILKHRLKSDRIIELYKINGTNNKNNILIIGVFHGEEPQGYYAINDYFFNNKFSIPKNNLYIIPCLNPDGMANNSRKNANGVDLNRNFPTKNWEKTDISNDYYGGVSAGSEEETQFCIKAVEISKPDLILTLHSPFAIVNFDGNASKIADKISELTEYPVEADIGYPTPGSFGTYCGIERNIPTITLEFDENESSTNIINKASKVFKWLSEEL